MMVEHLKDCYYLTDEIITPQCPKCMEIWNEWLDKNDDVMVINEDGTINERKRLNT